MKTLIKLLPLLTLSAGCAFRSDLDGDREVTIKRTAPAAEGDGLTSQRSRFGLVITDSRKKPAELRVYAKIDEVKTNSCTLATEAMSTIDATEKGYTFWCDVDALAVPVGHHNVHYWILNRDDEVAAQKYVTFLHDPTGPAVSAQAVRVPGGVRLTWAVEDEDDFAELTVHGHGVRLVSSFAKQSTAIIDSKSLAGIERLELRAFDDMKNEGRTVVELPK